jgi:malonyl-CoA decarboxylase
VAAGGDLDEALRPALAALCARYLTTVRPNGKVADPVGNFHLANGAAVEQLHWLADPSPEGMSGSLGFMVNYRYDPEQLAARAAAYAADGTVAIAAHVRALLA